ncbi:MAG: MBL fold metallo-hydrolase [Bacillota bacterium]
MQVANGIEMLEISANVMGKPEMIYPTLIRDMGMAILVDTGYPGLLPSFCQAMDKAGVPFDKLSKIIITHHDVDHIGSLSAILKESSKGIDVLAHEEEKPYLQGEKCPTKVTMLEAKLDSLPEQMKTIYENLKAFYHNNKIKVSRTIADGEELPYCGGITVIYTLGHTSGHICLYHKQSKTLIAGDTLGVDEGRLIKPPSFINFDQELALKSLKKLAQYDIETVICYHGGLYRGNATQHIIELANES